MYRILNLSLLGNLHFYNIDIDDLCLLKFHHIVAHGYIEHWNLLKQSAISGIDESFPKLVRNFNTLVQNSIKIYQL